MNDYFALLGLSRRPLLEAQQLKDSYHRLAAGWHPDAAEGDEDKFRTLQDAYQTLREPASRLRHLSEVVYGPGGNSARPARYTSLFMTVGAVMQDLKAFQKRYDATRSSLARAVLHQEKLGLRDRIEAAKAEVDAALAAELRELEGLDARWPAVTTDELLALSSGLRFLTRWQAELAEAGFGLQLSG